MKKLIMALKWIIFLLINLLVTSIYKPGIPHTTYFNRKAVFSMFFEVSVWAHKSTWCLNSESHKTGVLEHIKAKKFYLLLYNAV
jgi:fatty-acid desaturase